MLIRKINSVKTYDVSKGHLYLEHNYPRPKHGNGTGATESACSVPVDINATLETMRSEDLSVGAWLNVLGYVRHQRQVWQSQPPPKQRQRQQEPPQNEAGPTITHSVYVDAVMVFPAGSVEIGEYERILKDLQVVEKTFGRSE